MAEWTLDLVSGQSAGGKVRIRRRFLPVKRNSKENELINTIISSSQCLDCLFCQFSTFFGIGNLLKNGEYFVTYAFNPYLSRDNCCLIPKFIKVLLKVIQFWLLYFVLLVKLFDFANQGI